jgi:hypothetical protein
MRYILLSLLWLFAPPLAAQEPGHACARVAGSAARLACYDKVFPPPPEVNEEAARQVEADFGLNKPREPLRNPGQTVEQADPERIETRVVKVDYDRSGLRSFNLENGQVWMQAESRSTGHVQAGDAVQVRKGLLGVYQLVMPNGVTLRVRRTH